MSHVCEKVERFDDMCEYIKRVMSMEQEMSEAEREYMTIAFKEAVNSRRRSWRAICSLERQEEERQSRHINIVRDYRDRIEKEMMHYIEDMVNILEGRLIPNSLDVEAETRAYYMKMKADYCRYIAEVTTGDQHTRHCEKAVLAYDEGLKLVSGRLSPAHPLLLSIHLNRTVMAYEVLCDDEGAVRDAKAALEAGVKDVDNIEEDEAQEASVLLKMLKDNLTLWTTNHQHFEGHEGGKKAAGVDAHTMKSIK